MWKIYMMLCAFSAFSEPASAKTFDNDVVTIPLADGWECNQKTAQVSTCKNSERKDLVGISIEVEARKLSQNENYVWPLKELQAKARERKSKSASGVVSAEDVDIGLDPFVEALHFSSKGRGLYLRTFQTIVGLRDKYALKVTFKVPKDKYDSSRPDLDAIRNRIRIHRLPGAENSATQ
ncbi:MAG: hypothetical protein ACXVCS_10955 [Bdellovibrionota bacterium]